MPVPILLLVGVMFLTGRAAFKVYGVLQATVSRTFTLTGQSEPGQSEPDPTTDAE